MPQELSHLLVAGFTEARDFKSTLSVRKEPAPQQDRRIHGAKLLGQLANLVVEEDLLRQRRAQLGLTEHVGTTVSIQIEPPGALDFFRQLEWKRDGIEILSALEMSDSDIVTLHVPDGKLSAFEKRVTAYINEDAKPRKDAPPNRPLKPKHAALVNAISSFRKAAFSELWTDEDPITESEAANAWYQVWLRLTGQDAKKVRDDFGTAAEKFGLHVEAGYVAFPGRIVVAVNGTQEQLQLALELLDSVAEIRGVKATAEFFLSDLKPYEQVDWMQNLQGRLSYSEDPAAPCVTLLDTGVNRGHGLLRPVIATTDLYAASETWGTADHHGHGTQMAGIATYGDLTPALSGSHKVHVPHRLESVKLLPPHGSTPPRLYGTVTGQAVDAAESAKDRRRTFAMMTTVEGKCTGLPTEWSASIDKLAFGMPLDGNSAPQNPKKRLFVMSAGNIPISKWGTVGANDLYAIEDPGQAWNAVTVGAYTELDQIDLATWPSLTPIAKAGGMSPCSRTSMLWRRTWPFKPDVVAEGGNGSHDPILGPADGPESLRLVSTSHDPATSPFTETGDTSASAAEVARICGHITSKYPAYWPETVRALIVHGARITPAMRASLPPKLFKKDKEQLLRRVGYGKVSMEESVNSTRQRPTLILQESLTPYTREKSQVKLGKMNLHELPWPEAALLGQLSSTEVSLRITLSYFVAPNPSRRGWQSKYRYQSHGLRFAVQGSTESDAGFLQRINKIEREELEEWESPESISDPDGEWWTWGAQLRSRGSIHSDVWRGNGARLAQKSRVAVFPVGGWWKDWAGSEEHDKPVRYSLIVSLEAPEAASIDIYTPIANQIGITVPVEV